MTCNRVQVEGFFWGDSKKRRGDRGDCLGTGAVGERKERQRERGTEGEKERDGRWAGLF